MSQVMSLARGVSRKVTINDKISSFKDEEQHKSAPFKDEEMHKMRTRYHFQSQERGQNSSFKNKDKISSLKATDKK